LGFNLNIGTRKDVDGDGIRDKSDSCYKTFGVMSNNGCPLGFLGGSMNYDEQLVDSTSNTESSSEIIPVKADIQSETSAPVSEINQEVGVASAVQSEVVAEPVAEPKVSKSAKPKKVKEPKKRKKQDADLTSAMKD
jgi:hypothetical protein